MIDSVKQSTTLPTNCRALVVGGGRGMGAWIARLLRDNAVECCICDTHAASISNMSREGYDARYYSGNDARPFLDASDRLLFDLLILAVPIAQMEKAATVFCCHCQPGTLIMDVCSTKVDPLNSMERHTPSGCEVLGTHPLFGPKIYPPISQTWILTPSSTHPPNTWEPRMRRIIQESGALVYRTTADVHDEAMQIVQVGTHLTLLVFGTFLDDAQRSFNEMQNFKTPVFELLSSLAARVYAQNPALYFSIQKQPRAESTQSVFSRALSRVQTLLDNATLDEFTEHHERVKKWIGDTNVVALDHVISSAIRTIADERKLIRSHLGDVVCMRNIETGKIHYGLLESIDPPLVRIRKRKETVALSLKKVTLLSTEEKHAWLVATGKTGHMFVSFLAPRAAKSHTIANIVGTVHGVVSAQVWDEYIRDAETSEVKQTIKVCVDPDVGADSIAVAIRDLLTDLGYKVV